MAKTEWLGRDTFPRLWIWVCIAFNWVGILALLLLAIAEVVLISNDYRNYVHVMGYKYRGSAVSCAYEADTRSCAPLSLGHGGLCGLYECA